MLAKVERKNIQGNEACALGAIAAGCRFFAGYPITPSSEIAHTMARDLPGVGGTFIQMEDEIASIAAIIGASMGGAKVMTATSGPGFSLKQENLGYAAMVEVPCVIANVMRGGPSTGMPTRPGQGDIMQTRWGTHGDHPIIVLAPESVGEVYSETIRGFNLSEALRVPVVILIDETIGHLLETVDLAPPPPESIIDRKWASCDPKEYKPYERTEDMVPAMARPGDGYRSHTTGLTHDETGFPTQDVVKGKDALGRLLDKLEYHRDKIESYEETFCDDAQTLIVTIGISARASKRAVKNLRAQGIKAGLFRPKTLWPFPEEAMRKAASKAKTIIVPEMNAGQLIHEVERVIAGKCEVTGVNRYAGDIITPSEVEDAVRKATS